MPLILEDFRKILSKADTSTPEGCLHCMLNLHQWYEAIKQPKSYVYEWLRLTKSKPEGAVIEIGADQVMAFGVEWMGYVKSSLPHKEYEQLKKVLNALSVEFDKPGSPVYEGIGMDAPGNAFAKMHTWLLYIEEEVQEEPQVSAELRTVVNASAAAEQGYRSQFDVEHPKFNNYEDEILTSSEILDKVYQNRQNKIDFWTKFSQGVYNTLGEYIELCENQRKDCLAKMLKGKESKEVVKLYDDHLEYLQQQREAFKVDQNFKPGFALKGKAIQMFDDLVQKTDELTQNSEIKHRKGHQDFFTKAKNWLADHFYFLKPKKYHTLHQQSEKSKIKAASIKRNL